MADLRPTRRRSPSKDEWERVKPQLMRYYLEDGLPLKEVSAILASKYKFQATPCMYKTRLKKWTLRKNFKQEELAAAADKAEIFVKAGMQPPPMQIDDRSIPLDRVKRHFGEVLRESSLWTKVNQHQSEKGFGPYRCQQARKYLSRRRLLQIPRVHCQQSPAMYMFEITLKEVDAYYTWRLTVDDNYFLDHQQPDSTLEIKRAELTDPWEFCRSILDWLRFIEAKDFHLAKLSHPQLKRALESAAHPLSHKHPESLKSFINLSGVKWGNTMAGHLHKDILSYLAALARKTFVESHPIRLILNLCQHQGELQLPQFKILTLMREILIRHFGPASQRVHEVHEIEEYMAMTLYEQAGFASAHDFCQSKVLHYAKVLGKDHQSYRNIQCRVAMLLFGKNRVPEAWSICEELVGNVPLSAKDSHPHDLGAARAAHMMGCICQDHLDVGSAAMWFHQAVKGYEQIFGAGHSETLKALQSAEQMEAKVQAHQTMGNVASSESSEEAETTQEFQALFAKFEYDLSQLDLEAADGCMRQEGPWNMYEANATIDALSSQATERAPRVTLNIQGKGISMGSGLTSYGLPLSLVTAGQEVRVSLVEDPYPNLMACSNPGPPSEQLETTDTHPSHPTFATTPAPGSLGLEQYCPPLPTLSNDIEMAASDVSLDMDPAQPCHKGYDGNRPFNLDQYINDYQQFSTGDQQPLPDRYVDKNQQFNLDEQMQFDLTEQFSLTEQFNLTEQFKPDQRLTRVPQTDLSAQFHMDWISTNNQPTYATSQAGPSSITPDEQMLDPDNLLDQDVFLQAAELIDWSMFDLELQGQEQCSNTPHTQDQTITEVR